MSDRWWRPGSLAAVCTLAVILGVVPGRAAVLGTCTITIGASGTLRINAGLNQLSSRQAGGNAATATVNPQSIICNIAQLLDCYTLSVQNPAGFTAAPSGAANNLVMSSIMRINGGADIPSGTPVVVANGSKALTVDLAANKTSGTFPAGSYQALVTIRCE